MALVGAHVRCDRGWKTFQTCSTQLCDIYLPKGWFDLSFNSRVTDYFFLLQNKEKVTITLLSELISTQPIQRIIPIGSFPKWFSQKPNHKFPIHMYIKFIFIFYSVGDQSVWLFFDSKCAPEKTYKRKLSIQIKTRI